ADLVQFTRLAQDLSGAQLADMVGRFEAVSRDLISVGGGRVVKTVGDEVMFLADTPEDGAQIAASLAETISAEPTSHRCGWACRGDPCSPATGMSSGPP